MIPRRSSEWNAETRVSGVGPPGTSSHEHRHRGLVVRPGAHPQRPRDRPHVSLRRLPGLDLPLRICAERRAPETRATPPIVEANRGPAPEGMTWTRPRNRERGKSAVSGSDTVGRFSCSSRASRSSSPTGPCRGRPSSTSGSSSSSRQCLRVEPHLPRSLDNRAILPQDFISPVRYRRLAGR